MAAIVAATPANTVVQIKTWACRGSAAKSAGRSSGMVLCFVFGQFRGLLKAGRPVWSALLMSRAIDVLHLGRDRVICAYEVGGAIVDPGPASTVDTLIDRWGRSSRARSC